MPAGIHKATWTELEVRFGVTPWRRFLLLKLREALEQLRRAHCRNVSEGRRAQKERYWGEVLPADMVAEPAGISILDFFQRNRASQAKGIIEIDLETGL